MPIKRRLNGVLSSLVDRGLDKFLPNDHKPPPSSGRQQRSGSHSSDSTSLSSQNSWSSSSGSDSQSDRQGMPHRKANKTAAKSRSPSPVTWPYPNMSITECLLSLPNDDWVRTKHLPLKHYLGACRAYKIYAKSNPNLSIFDTPYGKDGWTSASLSKVRSALSTDPAFIDFTNAEKDYVLGWLSGAKDERAEAKLRDMDHRSVGRARQ